MTVPDPVGKPWPYLLLAMAITAGGLFPSGARAMAQGAAADTPEPLSVEEVTDFRSLPSRVAPVLSPDGDRMAYVVEGPKRTLGRIDELLDGSTEAWTELRIVHMETGATELAVRNAWAPAWSPRGPALAFRRADEGLIRLAVAEWTDEGVHTSSPTDQALWGTWMWTRPRWTPDGRGIVEKVLPADLSTDEMLLRARPAPPDEEGRPSRHHPDATVEVFQSDPAGRAAASATEETAPSDASGPGIPPWMRHAYGGDLAVVDVVSGQVRRLTTGRTPLTWRVAPDGSAVAFLELEGLTRAAVDYKVVTVPLAGGPARVVARQVRQTLGRGLSWSPDASRLAYLSGGDQEAAGVWVVGSTEGPPCRIARVRPGWDPEVPPTWSSDGQALLLTGTDTLWRLPVPAARAAANPPVPLATLPGHRLQDLIAPRANDHRQPASDGTILMRVVSRGNGEAGFARIDTRSGEVLALHTAPGAVGGPNRTDLSVDGRAAVSLFADTRRAPEFWRLGPHLRREQQLTRINPGFQPERLGEDRLVEWATAEGATLAGTLLLPPGHDPAAAPQRPLPLIVVVYGGDSGAAAFDTFDRHRQLLASRGYAVLVPSIPLEVGTPLRDHAEAVLPAVDRLVEMGIADPERVGVTGHSYGGYGTLSLLVQSDRFAAAVASAAQGDLVANYGHMTPDGTDRMAWSEQGQGRMGGTLWEVPDRYLENSPLWRLDRVRTPLLLLHGADDPTVPVWLAEAVFTALRRLDRPVALARYSGEGHWWGDWSRANQIDYWTRLIAWFDRYLGLDAPL